MTIYLDNCCYNRPYDDQSQLSVFLETQSKLHIQELIRQKKLSLAASYVLRYECEASPFEMRREAIRAYIQENAELYVGAEHKAEIEEKAHEIMRTGIKHYDACHVACAIRAGCDYFITTDKRLLKFRTSEIKIVTPIEFVLGLEAEENVRDK